MYITCIAGLSFFVRIDWCEVVVIGFGESNLYIMGYSLYLRWFASGDS